MFNQSFSSLHKLVSVVALFAVFFCTSLLSETSHAQTVEFNSSGGTTSTNGLHFYIDRTSKIQVRRLNNTGQVYSPTALPQTNPNNLDNGVFLRANGLLYGPSHTVTTFNPTGGMYSSYSISAASPASSTPGIQQTATNLLGVNNGPQITIVWKYTTPLDFLTAEVKVVIPSTYTTISATNPVRYYHVFDTYLGGSDNGCGVNVAGTYRIVGTYSSLGGATPCPVSTSLPTSGTIVESFRERSPPIPPPGAIAVTNFSSYCAAGWSSFFVNGNPYCSVLQLTRPGSTTGAMSNTITTSLIDTGIGIAYDFTAPGTYVFSYDFVIGSTAVPPYDHLEIRHDGSASLCPETIQVLACLSSTVPCPAGSEVSSGVLTGSIGLTPSAPAPGVTFTPSSFSIGGSSTSGPIANMILQAAATSAGTYTFIPSGLSSTPLNGTRCVVNGVAQASCQLTITNTPCVADFECMESSLTYNNQKVLPAPAGRNPLYTKVANQGFRFDVLALQSSGSIANTYTGNVFVDLIDEGSGTACAAPTAVATQNLSFASTDNGRKTLSADFLVTGAYKKMRCRVRESAGSAPLTACSSDRFTVRPQSFTSLTSNANANAGPGGLDATAAPTVTAGNNFTLTANTNTNGYDGLPKISADSALYSWANAPFVVGKLTGVFSEPADSSDGNGASGSAFKYDEVGYFRILAQGLYDDTFVSSAGAADSTTANTDCIQGSSSNVKDAVSGLYGCNFANTADTPLFGRFIPHHFTIGNAKTTEACPAITPFVPFTYFGQDGAVTIFTLTAKNSGDNTTKNYTGNFAKFVLADYSKYYFSLSGEPTGATLSSSATAPTGSWLSGVAVVSAKHQISRPTALENETIITINAAPSDGEVITPTDTPLLVSTTKQRYGRMKLQSAYGSEMLDLPVPFIAEYRNGGQWLKNVDDSCTVITAPSAGTGLIFYPESTTNHLTTGETTASVSATGTLVAGDSKLKFSKPGAGNSGYLDLNIPVSAWLQFPWRGGATAINPTAKVKFGAYKKSNQFIYMREVH